MTDIFKCVVNNSIQDIERLLENGTDLNSEDQFGVSILYFAVGLKQHNIVRLLLDRGANANGSKFVPLCVAAMNDDIVSIAMLLMYSANPNLSQDNMTSLQLAVIHDNFEMIKLLLDYGAKFNES